MCHPLNVRNIQKGGANVYWDSGATGEDYLRGDDLGGKPFEISSGYGRQLPRLPPPTLEKSPCASHGGSFRFGRAALVSPHVTDQ